MNDDLIDVLIVEDNDADADLLREYLSENRGGSFRTVCTHRLSAALQTVSARSYDLILLDLNLPDSAGLETLKRMRTAVGSTPIIVVTGSFEGRTGVDALHSGANDYFLKDRVDSQLLAKAVLRQIRWAERAEKREKSKETGTHRSGKP